MPTETMINHLESFDTRHTNKVTPIKKARFLSTFSDRKEAEKPLGFKGSITRIIRKQPTLTIIVVELTVKMKPVAE